MNRLKLTLCSQGNFSCFFVVCWFFKINVFKKNLSGILSECQTDWIWVQTVCKGYQQVILVGNGLFDLILYVPVNNFSVMSGRVNLGWTSTQQGLMCLAQGHNTVTPVTPRWPQGHNTVTPVTGGLESSTLRSLVDNELKEKLKCRSWSFDSNRNWHCFLYVCTQTVYPLK